MQVVELGWFTLHSPIGVWNITIKKYSGELWSVRWICSLLDRWIDCAGNLHGMLFTDDDAQRCLWIVILQRR